MAFDMKIDILGTQPALFKLYTQLAFVFVSKGTPSEANVTGIITRGLGRLTEGFPWVAGQVVNTNAVSSGAPAYRIRPFELQPRLVVRNYESDLSVPSFQDMQCANLPMRMMGEDLWAPCPTVASLGFDPSKSSGNNNDPAPVLLLQLNIIRGGLILCINMQHNTCDMMGQAAVMGWLSKACRSEEFSKQELALGRVERRGIIPLIEEVGRDLRTELKHQIFPSQPVANTQSEQMPRPTCSWIYFNFTSSTLKRLKVAAESELPDDFTGYISTDDSLCAFIFKSILRARQSRFDADLPVTFARAVDARRYLGVDAQYPGILQNMTYTSYPLSILLATPLGHIAAAMRQQVDPKTCDVARRTRALATFMSRPADNAAKTSPTATLNSEADIMLSSWGKVPAYEWDFGLGLGPAAAVRRPAFLPVESLMYTMPRNRDGTVAVAMCLRQEDIRGLESVTEWTHAVCT